MLHAFLHLHLDGALLLTDVERHVTQPMGKELAKGYDEGGDEQQSQRQSTVHGVHEQEGTRELDTRDDKLRQQRRGDFRNGVDILGET